MAMHLTGFTRWRLQTRWAKPPLLVVQVEWSGTESDYLDGRIYMEDRRYWRDATVTDMQSPALCSGGKAEPAQASEREGAK